MGPRGDFPLLKTISMDLQDLSPLHLSQGGSDHAKALAVNRIKMPGHIQNTRDRITRQGCYHAPVRIESTPLR